MKRKSSPKVLYLTDCFSHVRNYFARDALIRHAGAMKDKRIRKRNKDDYRIISEEYSDNEKKRSTKID